MGTIELAIPKVRPGRRASGSCSGVDVGPSKDTAFWTAFRRSLVKRGLKGVRLVISDAHEGLRARFAKTAPLLEDAAEDVFAYRHLPLEHSGSCTARTRWNG